MVKGCTLHDTLLIYCVWPGQWRSQHHPLTQIMMCTAQYFCVLLWCRFSTGEAEEAQLFIFSSSSSLFLSSFPLCVPQPFGCVKTPWIIYTPTATGVTNAKKEGAIWGEIEVRRTATNKELKGEGNETTPGWVCCHYTSHEGSGYSTLAGNDIVFCSLTPLATAKTLHVNMFQVMLCDWIFIWNEDLVPRVQVSSHTF